MRHSSFLYRIQFLFIREKAHKQGVERNFYQLKEVGTILALLVDVTIYKRKQRRK